MPVEPLEGRTLLSTVVTAVAVNEGDAQRATVRSLSVTFNADADTRLVITLELVQPVQAPPPPAPPTATSPGIYE